MSVSTVSDSVGMLLAVCSQYALAQRPISLMSERTAHWDGCDLRFSPSKWHVCWIKVVWCIISIQTCNIEHIRIDTYSSASSQWGSPPLPSLHSQSHTRSRGRWRRLAAYDVWQGGSSLLGWKQLSHHPHAMKKIKGLISPLWQTLGQ